MTDLPYLNRELDEKFSDIQASLGRIETQTTKTNGRVNNLETWQSYVLGFCACITILLLPIVFILANRFLP